MLSDRDYYDNANYYAGVIAPHFRDIEYLDRTPKQIEVQISLVEYFERIKRVKADRWQRHFCDYLQNAVVNRQATSTLTEFHAQAQLGKTVLLSQTFPAWCFGHDPLFRYVLAMYNISRSQAHTEVVIQIMRSKLHRDIFSDTDSHLPSVVSKEGFMTNARRDSDSGNMDAQRSMSAVGLESGMTGSGFDWLTIDDPYKDPRDAFSETNYDNLARFWSYGVVPRMGDHSCVAAMFHRYNYDDFGGYLLNTGKFDYVRYASEADGPYLHDETGQRFEDPLGREKGELICPERFGPSYYTDKRADNKVWLSMFQGRPGKEEGEFFKVGKIGIATEAEWEAVVFKARGWDHAATSGGGDKSAGALEGMLPDGTCIIGDVFSDQLDSAARVEKQRELAELDGYDTTVVVPQGLGADGKDNVFLMQQNLQRFNVVPRSVTNAGPGSDAKKRRAYNFSVAVNSGKVKFLSGKWVERVQRLMRRFGNSLSGDDEIDALSDTYNHLYEQFYKGLVIKGFRSSRNIVMRDRFNEHFKPKVANSLPLQKIPETATIYAALSITADASRPNSGVLVARSPANWWLDDTLFVLAEYKAYTADFYPLFDWMMAAMESHCDRPDKVGIWLTPESAEYEPAIWKTIKRRVNVFEGDAKVGIPEMNWYFTDRDRSDAFTQGEKAAGLYLLPRYEGDLTALQQEITTWGYNDKGLPKGDGSVANCLRMIAYEFRTRQTPLTREERQELVVAPQFRQDAIERAIEAGASDEDVSRMNVTRTVQMNMPKVLQGKKAGGRFSRFKR